jgi:DNA-binding HxlR family transcriptional regulator
MLGDAVNASILRLLARGALSVDKLQEHLGPVSRTTRFDRLRELEDLGVIIRKKEGGVPPQTHCMLSPAGHELLVVTRLLRRWLKESPNRTLGNGDLFGVLETKALGLGWNSTALRWLAERPCSLTELEALSPPEVSYHELRKTRGALSAAGLIAPLPGVSRKHLYKPTDWMRNAARAIAAAMRWEGAFPADGDYAGPATLEMETLLLLFMSSIKPLPPELSGACSLRLDSLGAVAVELRAGRIATCAPAPPNIQTGRISGSVDAWLDALVDGESVGLRVQGNERLGTALLHHGFAADDIRSRYGRII